MTAAVALLVALSLMLLELRRSTRNELRLRALGAVAAEDPVYGTMRWAYPGVFTAMAAEGAVFLPAGPRLVTAGALVFVVAKLLKAWAIYALGDRWTFRVLVLPGAPLVRSGPYRWMRHPNYVAVVGEITGFALLAGARLSGILAVLLFGELLRRRIRAEEQALGLSRPPDQLSARPRP